MARKITTSQGFWYGLKLLGQVTGILAISAALGWGIDELFNVAPFGLAGSVVAGSLGATVLVVTETYKVME